MDKRGKRKHATVLRPRSKRSLTKSTVIDIEPYPNHNRPTSEECLTIRNQLFSLHGFPAEFMKYRKQRLSLISTDGNREKHDEDHVKAELLDLYKNGEESVLDGLVKTVLSQNTTEINSLRAFTSLKAAFPTWEDVHAAEPELVESTIRSGGLAPRKTSCIKGLLNSLLERNGKLCLEYLRELSIDEVKAELSCFKGIGPKTVSCVLMFNLGLDDFPVDTHVFEISKSMGWIPDGADRNKTYLHLNRRIPDELKFDLNVLLYTHGKVCRECTRKMEVKPRKINLNSHGSCPLLDYQSRIEMKTP